jgi:hypothetical protein
MIGNQANQGYNIGIHQTAILMKQANIVAIRPRKRHYYPDAGTRYKKAEQAVKDKKELKGDLNSIWNLTEIGYGGAKPLNISVLNNLFFFLFISFGKWLKIFINSLFKFINNGRWG